VKKSILGNIYKEAITNRAMKKPSRKRSDLNGKGSKFKNQYNIRSTGVYL